MKGNGVLKKRVTQALLGMGILALLGSAALAGWIFVRLPSPDDLSAYTTAPSSKIHDRNGQLLFEMPPPYTGSHTPVTLADIPQHLIWATIATEDATFYDNPGMDFKGILRAVWINAQGGEVLAGGSTITQQLVRTVMFGADERAERTLRRKLRELALAVRITRRYSKDAILTLYLNETYYGNMAYGVEAAAQAYFGKHARDLDLAECALLAGLPQAPAVYNPLENLDAAKERQAVALDLMVKQGYIEAGAAQLAKAEKLDFAAAPFAIRAPHFVMLVRSQLERELGLARLQAGGLNVYTTLDVALTDTARDAIRHHLALLAVCHYEAACPPGGRNVRNAALVALDPWTGEIVALVGSPDYFAARIDGAVDGATALRQPGSSIKPLTYAAAFERGDLTPATMMLDVRTAFVTREGAPYVPLNYDLAFRGPVRLREALASSYNLIAVKVLDTIGIESLTGMARRLGITTFDDPDKLGLALALGGGEVRLLELTAAYAAFANGGYAVQPVLIRRVEDASGAVLWEPASSKGERALDARVAYLITDILSDDLARIPTFGEGSVLKLTRPAAVKTGTTTNFRDNWTVGYTPELVVGVWVGNADNETMKDVSGVTGAAPIWREVMEAALKGRPVRDFTRPDGLVDVEVCALSGQLPGPECPHRVTETFIAGTEPTETCTMHQQIDGVAYTILPPEAQDWAREHHIPQPSARSVQPLAINSQPSAFASSIRITSPDSGAVYRIDPAQPRDMQKIVIAAAAEPAFERVILLVDGLPLAQLTAPPYTHLWQLEPGAHAFSAVGVTADGAHVSGTDVTIEVRE
ncbi:MAG TPA: PBP1A family penicillin-binding protein [Anaerolineae bacterium]|nr:PBP1A family penicillin-binding protein [Anaerolineae bacterium]HQI85262.1 PBP1A family penicillin-binding protein [Anaerolineae bacterium]